LLKVFIQKQKALVERALLGKQMMGRFGGKKR
jgi:hypothetical protein